MAAAKILWCTNLKIFLSSPLWGLPDSSAGKESTCSVEDPSSIPGRSLGEGIGCPHQYSWASLVAQVVKNPSVMQETWVWSLGWKDPLEKGKATHSSILAWRISWAEESGGLQSMAIIAGHVMKQTGFQNVVPGYRLSCILWKIKSFHFPTSLLVVDIVRYLTIWWIWQSISFPKFVFASENIFLTYYILICIC